MNAETLLAGKTVTFINDNSIPSLGTPQRASYDADLLGTIHAHTVALNAWNAYIVHSFGGSVLRTARIQHHTAKIATLKMG